MCAQVIKKAALVDDDGNMHYEAWVEDLFSR